MMDSKKYYELKYKDHHVNTVQEKNVKSYSGDKIRNIHMFAEGDFKINFGDKFK